MWSDGLNAAAVGRPRARLDRSRPADLPRAPDRQRGLWTFLTWPFLLLQVEAAGVFLGNGPNPSDEEDQQANAHTPGPSPTTSDLVNDENRLMAAVDPEQQRDDTDTAHHPTHAGPVALFNSGQSAESIPYVKFNAEREPVDSGGGGGGSGASDNGDSNNIDDLQGTADDLQSTAPSVDSLLTMDLEAGSDGPMKHFVASPSLPSEFAPPISLDLHPPISLDVGVSLGPSSDANSSPTANVELGSDEALNGTANLDLQPISVTSTSVAINASPNLAELIGFKLQVDVAGTFVSGEVDLGLNVNPADLVSAVAQPTDITPQALLGFDLEPPVGSLFSQSVMSAFGHNELPTSLNGLSSPASELAKSITELTGLQGVIDGKFVSASLNHLADEPGAIPSRPIDLSGQSQTGSPSDPILPQLANIVVNPTDVNGLEQNGHIASGNTIAFSPSPLTSDELFAGGHYTEYNVALQSINSTASQSTRAVENGVAIQTPVPNPVDIPPDNHSGTVTSSGQHQLDTPLAQQSSSLLEELSVRVVHV